MDIQYILAFLLLNRDARPVAGVLVGAGKPVEQRRLAAVRVTGKGYRETHLAFPLPSSPS